MAEGILHGNLLQFMIGFSGVLVIITVLMASRKHEQRLDQHLNVGRRAERAADAMASVGMAKSRFFAAVSHDLRQPVHAIGLYLDTLIRDAAATGSKDTQRAVEGIRLSWKALDGLLSQVLDLTRMDAGALQPRIESVELCALVRSLIMQHSPAAERREIRLVALGGKGRFALVDELMLKRVVSNLIDNSIKFSKPGGTVVVAVRHAREAWRLQVRDGGKGIAAETQAQVFDEFVQIDNEARNRQHGYGLGLAISKRFVDLMGGRLAVRSALDQGCVMTVTLNRGEPHERVVDPLAISGIFSGGAVGSGTTQHVQPPDAEHVWLSKVVAFKQPSDEPVLAPQIVLLVEDDLLVAGAMRQLLQSWGQRVIHVECGADALACSPSAQIAICDVRLPRGESGIDVAMQLRSLGNKVLLVTGETGAQVRQAALENGLVLLAKPLSPSRLLKALRDLSRPAVEYL